MTAPQRRNAPPIQSPLRTDAPLHAYVASE